MTELGRSPKVAVVAGYEWIFVSPSTVSSVEMLAEHGYRVDLLARRQSQHFPGTGIDRLDVRTAFYPWNDEGWNPSLQNLAFAAWATWVCFRRRPQLLLAIDPEALVGCAVYAAITRTPVFYFSLEIATWHPYSKFAGNPLRFAKRWLGAALRNGWKLAEALAHRQAVLTIIQESNRAEVLRQENRLKKMEVAYVPPSLRTSYHPRAKPRYLREKLGLRSGQVVVLAAGGIADYYLVHELVRAAYQWPENWVLVVHGWFQEHNRYHRELERLCDGRKVILSKKVLRQEEFDAMVASADVGVALYKNVGPNHFHITSGKLMQYLRCGLPVVATDFPNLREIVEKHGCGLCVPDPAAIASTIAEILREYPRFSQAARVAFDEHFRFDLHFTRVIGAMDSHLRGRWAKATDSIGAE